MKTMVFATSQEQGSLEAAMILRDIGSNIEVESTTGNEYLDRNGYVSVKGDELAMAKLEGMIMMIELMSPGGQGMTQERDALRRLQQLVNGNLGCIEPKLEAFDDN